MTEQKARKFRETICGNCKKKFYSAGRRGYCYSCNIKKLRERRIKMKARKRND